MSRRSFFLAIGIALVLIGGTSATIFLLVRHEPASYRLAAVPPGPDRREQSQEFYSEISPIVSIFDTGSVPEIDRAWDIHLTDKQVNSFLSEGFRTSKLDERLLPEGVSDPRVNFEPNRVRLAFRVGKGLWSSVISIDFNLWLTQETNAIALKLLGLQAGSLPIGAQALLDDLTKMLEHNGIQVDWYRDDDAPVAVLRFSADTREPTMQLQYVKVEKGSIRLRGKPVDSIPTRAAALTGE
jgi:hypothetical protein